MKVISIVFIVKRKRDDGKVEFVSAADDSSGILLSVWREDEAEAIADATRILGGPVSITRYPGETPFVTRRIVGGPVASLQESKDREELEALRKENGELKATIRALKKSSDF